MTHSKIFDYLDPVIFSIGPFQVKWYAIAYIAGILIGQQYAIYLIKKFQLKVTKSQIEDFITWLILGIIIGGRIGYVIFYEPIRYLNNPIEILKIYEGGMSFHGAVAGVYITILIFSKLKKIRFLLLLDLTASAAPIGIFFGRCANFVNQELFGRITDSSFGIIFPGDYLPRHPSQLYEAFFEGLVLFFILLIVTVKYKSITKPGLNSGIAMFFYGIFRIILENFREPDPELGLIFAHLTMGQLQSIPLLIFGLVLIVWHYRNS
jgi:phosphatidylglycerol:prolipoprotein diacylglycerol transferase